MSDGDIEVHKKEGPLLLLAGPGTGKTYQLARRIKFLVEEQGVDPKKITVITFTAAAAANMRARISDPGQVEVCIDGPRQPHTICTMHSLGYRIIADNYELAGLRARPGVVTSDELKKILLGDAAQLAALSRAEADATLNCRQHGRCVPGDDPKCRICARYRDILQGSDAIDYDDQILVACKLLRAKAELASRYREQALHLLVDEYQDINAGQFELVRILSEGQTGGLFVVGDDDQSIYSWRGGSPEFVRRFEEHFGPEATVETLVDSYRCHRNILEGALAVVKRYDRRRRDKDTYRYKRADGPRIAVHNVPSDKKEAAIILEIVKRALPSKRVLVLVRTRRYGSLICQHLRRARVPYIAPEPLPGEGLPILERMGAWIESPQDNLALRECLEAMLDSDRSPIPSSRARKADKKERREQEMSHVAALWGNVIGHEASLWQSLEEGAARHEVLRFLKEQCDKLREYASEDNPGKLLGFATTCLGAWHTVKALREEIETWVNRHGGSSDSGSGAMVRVMTYQGAKGLEAEVVCVVGLEKGAMPRESRETEALAEESRLMFVSMTRAKDELHLFHARNRSAAVSFQAIHQDGGPHVLSPSPFLDVIPEQCRVKKYHASSA